MARRPMYKQPSPQLSGHSYVPIALRSDIEDGVRPCWVKLPMASDHKCDGVHTMCHGTHDGKPCAELWTYDHKIRWHSTEMGRCMVDWWRSKGVTLNDD